MRGSCPAYGKLCNNCKSKKNFAKCCNIKTVNNVHKHQDSSESDENSKIFENEALFIGAISNEDFIPFGNDNNKWTTDLDVNNTLISFKIDTGAQAKVMPFRVFFNLQNRPKLQPSKFRLSAYNGTNIPVKGCHILHITHGITSIPVLFHFVDNDSPFIRGLKTSKNLDLIRHIMKVNSCVPDYLQQYTDCFGEIGCLKAKHHIIVDREVPPVIHPPRHIPASLKMKLNEELDRMVKMEIITLIEEPTDWLSSLHIVEKPNGQLRICLDPRHLNQAIKHLHFVMPTAEEILAQMSNAKFFTKLDNSNTHWQIPVNDESSKLLTFNSPNGRYCLLLIAFCYWHTHMAFIEQVMFAKIEYPTC